ncbi:sodium-coupled monocarboxylate transporter 2-like isoform X2 [Condylostylus longicornis]|uniref:sodium-coupled monocarboxylate transporter 2-like isoform X2 n=2 Tax=Condylostylus longicornis TaxID=2530218 RepID=UPI00244DD955|nr:sodium-coupled monocarboxylate transporter 2-like isoform X2 [Condylostylus longicornis]
MNKTFSFNGFDSNFHYSINDHILFVSMMIFYFLIGLLFGYFSKNTSEDYLLGERKMKTIPIAISLIASQMSSLSIVTIPTEIYEFGLHYYWMIITLFLSLIIINYIIVPVYYKNDISNCYKYLEMRFDKKTRQLITVSFVGTIYLVIPVIIFVPALAFAQVTGLNIHLINGIVCAVCVFYTMLGGIKAVVWTDVVQAAIMLLSIFLIVTMGVYKVGGLQNIFYRAQEGGRLNLFDMTFDLTTRSTFWNCFLGGISMWTTYIALNQSCVQRIVALPSLSHARRSLTFFAIGFCIIMSLNTLTGIVMFAKYFECDPVKTGVVEKADKLVPYFVQDIVGDFKGMPGIFISCVFSAALSTMSANLNSLSGVLYFDYIRPYINHTEKKANFIMKTLVILTGIYCILGGFLVEKFKSILQMVITIVGITQGAVLGTFMFGMLYPRAHSKAAFWSSVGSVLLMSYIVIGAQIEIANGNLKYIPLPTSTDGCEKDSFTLSENLTTSSTIPISKDDQLFSIHKISFNWYVVIGAVSVWIFGVPLSYILKNTDKKLKRNLVSPVIENFIPKDLLEPEEIPLKADYIKNNMMNIEK